MPLPPKRPTPQQIQADRQRATVQAAEVLGYISHRLAPPFSLRDGTDCRVAFEPPKLNADGKLECAFDVLFADGSHLGFTVGHTDWGKSFASAETQKVKPKGTGRRR
jgi:hypothetical protein